MREVATEGRAPTPSSSDLLARQVLDELGKQGVHGQLVRPVDHNIAPGVETDMGGDDAWPARRRAVLAADILLISTPTWMGQMSSVAKRVLERLDAELSETDDSGRPVLFGKVAVVAVVGNEDGAHKIVADTFQALNDTGYSIPAQGCTYWNGEAMTPGDYIDLADIPDAVASANSTLAANAAHLARLLRQDPYPPPRPSGMRGTDDAGRRRTSTTRGGASSDEQRYERRPRGRRSPDPDRHQDEPHDHHEEDHDDGGDDDDRRHAGRGKVAPGVRLVLGYSVRPSRCRRCGSGRHAPTGLEVGRVPRIWIGSVRHSWIRHVDLLTM